MFSSRTNWPLEPNRFSQAVERHRGSGKQLLDLTNSNPTTCGFSYPNKEILAALSDRRTLRYAPESKGLRAAREAVAGYYCGRPGLSGTALPIDPEHIVLTSGTSEAYSHIFRLLCEPGDEILVPAPSYPLFEFLAELCDVRLVSYALLYDHGWQVDLAALRAATGPRTRAVILVHPNNPTGSFIKAHEAAELAQICAAHEMAIIADEVFLDYADNSAPRPSFATHSAALTFTLSGLSKVSLLPQMKLSWLVASGPPSLVETAIERLEVVADTFLSSGTLVQLALPKLLNVRAALQAQLRSRIDANLAYLDRRLRLAANVSRQNPAEAPGKGRSAGMELRGHENSANVSRQNPTEAPGKGRSAGMQLRGQEESGARITRLDREAGWYAILRLPATNSDEEFAIELLERCSVLVHPGHFYNFQQDGFLVLSLLAREAVFQEGARRLLELFA
jgi:alanine-synthesizing transaminase